MLLTNTKSHNGYSKPFKGSLITKVSFKKSFKIIFLMEEMVQSKETVQRCQSMRDTSYRTVGAWISVHGCYTSDLPYSIHVDFCWKVRNKNYFYFVGSSDESKANPEKHSMIKFTWWAKILPPVMGMKKGSRSLGWENGT